MPEVPARPLSGIVPPLVTPLSARDALDHLGLARLIEHVLAGGVQGLFILGTTGEGPCLSYRLRREMITQTCELVAGRVPVLVGITDTSFAESANLALVAADAGAAAVVLAPPYYVPLAQDELARHVEWLVPELPLPLVLYNMPGLTKAWYEPETLRRLADQEAIIGLKDSSGDLAYYAQALAVRDELRPDWSILIGPEHLLARSLEMGGDGGVSGGANVLPELFTGCYRAARRGDTAAARGWAERIDAFQAIYALGPHPSRYIQTTKAALAALGICSDRLSEPFAPLGAGEREAILRILAPLQEAGTQGAAAQAASVAAD